MKSQPPLGRVAMLSTHGYFDPVPQLGRTDTGGQVTYVIELSLALARRGVRVDIFTRWFDPERRQIDPHPQNPNVRVIRIPAGPWEFIPKEAIYPVLPELANRMVDFIRGNKLHYDLFHGHYVDAGIVTLSVAQQLAGAAFFTAHSLGAWKQHQMGGDPEEMERKFNFRLRIAEELRIFRSVRAQTVTTAVQKDIIRELYHFEGDNIAVIRPGVNVERFSPLGPDQPEVDTGLPQRYIFCLSRIDSNKGHDLLLNAFDLVRRSVPSVHLVIGGGSPKGVGETETEVLQTIRNIIREKGLQDNVDIVGYIPDELLAPAYQQAELFVLPSLFEPFGLTVLEAMACGRPVVASRLGGIREIITSGENGLLVDPRNDSEFAEAMVRLLKDSRLSQRLGQRGRRLVLEQFSWDGAAARHLDFYRQYLE